MDQIHASTRTSTAEAEYVAQSNAAKETPFLSQLLEELGYDEETLGVDIFANSKFGSHWQLLDQEAWTQFQDKLEEHNFAYRVVARHIHQLPSMPSIGHRDVIICLIRPFLDQTEGQATVEDAAVYLARSS